MSKKINKKETSIGLAKSITNCIDSRELNSIHADKITKFYRVPCARFASIDQLIHYYGFKLGEKFAEGGFATISYATHIKSGIKVACKKVNLLKSKGPPQTDKSKIEDLKNEIFIMRRLNNPYIVRLYAHFVINNDLYIFIKLANSGTLRKYIKSKGGVLRQREAQILFAQILVAFEYMHSKDIAHRDVKLDNILMLRHPNKKLTILITDFGLSRLVSYEKGKIILNKTYCGTLDFMSPEILLEKAYNAFMVDIWALGVTLFVMLNNKFPFEARNTSQQIKLQLKKEWKLTDNLLDDPPDLLIHFLSIMLEPEPLQRATISQLVQHPWILDEFLYAKTFFENYYKTKKRLGTIEQQKQQQQQPNNDNNQRQRRLSQPNIATTTIKNNSLMQLPKKNSKI